MKRYILLIIIAIIGLCSAQAQRIHAYVNAGLIGSQVEGDELKGMKHWGFTGGVGAIALLDDNGTWGLSLETDFSSRGAFEGTRSSFTPYNIKLDLHYIDIPLTLLYRDSYGGLCVGLGLTYGRLIAQPHGMVQYNPAITIVDSTDMAFLKNDLSPTLEIRFPIWQALQFSVRYQFSVIKVKENWHFVDPTGNHFKDENGKPVNDHYNDCYNQSLQLRLFYEFGGDDSHSKYRGKSSKKRRRY